MEIVDILLKNPESDVNVKDTYINYIFDDQEYNEISPLILAMNIDNTKIFDLLLNHPNIDVNMTIQPVSDRTTIWTPLHMSIMLNDYGLSYAKKLLNHPKIDVNIIANFDESTSILKNIVIFNEIPHFDVFFTPLHLAVELEKMEMIKLLLSHPNISLNEIEKYTTYTRVSYYISVNYKTVEQTVLHRSIQKKKFRYIKSYVRSTKIRCEFFCHIYL